MNTIYHYTDLNALLNIIQNGKLWLTNSRNLNDHQEVSWFLNKFKEAKGKALQAHPELKELEDLFHNLWMNLNYSFETHICSFSTESDRLSQWRAYADDGQGVAIGFKKETFKLNSNPLMLHVDPKRTIGIYNVIYDENKQNKLIEELVNKIIQFAKNGISSNRVEFFELMFEVSVYPVIFKNIAFEEEKEIRIVHIAHIDNPSGHISKAKHRVTAGTIATYFELNFQESGAEICKIRLGPKCKMTETDLKLFLKYNKIKDSKIEYSTATYR